MLGGGFNYPTGKKNPITIGFLALLVVGFLMTYFARAAFATPAIYVALESPVWTWVTYPFVFAEFLTIVFSGLWLAFMLAPLEVDKRWPLDPDHHRPVDPCFSPTRLPCRLDWVSPRVARPDAASFRHHDGLVRGEL